MNLLQLAELNEDQCRRYFESFIWPNGPVCPHCKSTKSTKLKGKSTRPGVYKCKEKECRKPFTITVGTVMERSRIPLKHWLMAIHLLCSSKKGFSAKQIERELGVTYKTAWFLLHRIRHAMDVGDFAPKLSGAVEVDETYVGGKPRIKGTSKRGRGTKKTPVVALVERDGTGIHSRPVEHVNHATLAGEVRKYVNQDSIIVTDDLPSYRGIGKHFQGGHVTVRHSEKEYVSIHPESGFPIHTNTVESFFALIKRGHYGVYHQMSKKHLHRYCAEFSFRWRNRKQPDGVRTKSAIASTLGRRFTYK